MESIAKRILNRIHNVLIAEALRDKLFIMGSVKSVKRPYNIAVAVKFKILSNQISPVTGVMVECASNHALPFSVFNDTKSVTA
jgi:hypothetical protein